MEPSSNVLSQYPISESLVRVRLGSVKTVATMEAGQSERLRIVPIAIQYAADLFNALDDPRVGTYIGGPNAASSAAYARLIKHWINGPSADSGEVWFNWVVLLAEEPIGHLQSTTHDDVAEVAYVFTPAHWGKGYATEATTWMLTKLKQLGAREAWATVEPSNAASKRLLRRLEFQRSLHPRDDLRSYDPGDEVYWTQLH